MMWIIILLALPRSILASTESGVVDTETSIATDNQLAEPLSVSAAFSPTVLTASSPTIQLASSNTSNSTSTATILVSATDTVSPSPSPIPQLRTQVSQQSELVPANQTNTTILNSEVEVRPVPSTTVNRVAMHLQVGGANSFNVDQRVEESQIESRPALIVSNDSNDSNDSAESAQQELFPPQSNNGSQDSGISNSAGETLTKQNDSPDSSSSNPGIIVGALLGVILLIIGGIAFYRSFSPKKYPSDHADESNLDIRYSLETASNSSGEKTKFSSGDFKLPDPIESDFSKDLYENKDRNVTYSDSNSSSQYQYLDPAQTSKAQLINSTYPGIFEDSRIYDGTGNQDDTAEILDIARSAQDAAQISGYLTKKYIAHDSIVSFDSFA